MTEVLVIGAGPAGMTAALELLAHGLAVTVVDDQTAPGGRIFAGIEGRKVKGAEESAGAALVTKFRAAGGEYRPRTEVWQIEPGPRVFMTCDGMASIVQPRFILMATGAQERPMPFSGWELPGVMTVGGAQLLFKTANQIPSEPVWLAGSGPLLLLYAKQLISVGGTVAGILDTTPQVRVASIARLVPGALGYGWQDLLRGIAWLHSLRGVQRIRQVVALEALGDGTLKRVSYETRLGDRGVIDTQHLFIHAGVVPSVHGTIAAGCKHEWNERQRCYQPVIGEFGATTIPNIFVAGDGASIAGAHAATLSGRLSGIGIACAAGKLRRDEAHKAAAPLRDALTAAARFRTLLDTLYPVIELQLADEALVCRCEEVTTGQIREVLSGRPQLGSDGVKIATRAGMGPCQGRQCGLTLARLVSEVHKIAPREVDFLRIRPPLKPLTVSELASLDVGQ